MVYSDVELRKLGARLSKIRSELLLKSPFYGQLLMNTNFALDASISTACTEGEKIYFSPNFIFKLTDSEIEFVLLHELLHIILNHCFRYKGKAFDLNFNIACDIVVNSNIFYSRNIVPDHQIFPNLGNPMHLAPNGKEGYLYTVEEVYKMLNKKNKHKEGGGKSVDDHSKWGKIGKSKLEELMNKWSAHVVNAYSRCKSHGSLTAEIERLIDGLINSKLDWRILLRNIIQEEINDYSFSPPDHRFEESDFFLPDFNEKDEIVKNVLFMVDTSGSITKKDLTLAFSEIKGAIDQFNGKLEGYIGFFDSKVYPAIPFSSVDELLKVTPRGGGGTNFQIIFNYVFNGFKNDLPVTIVILTDGYANYPAINSNREIPVLWLLNQENDGFKPPFGKVSTIK